MISKKKYALPDLNFPILTRHSSVTVLNRTERTPVGFHELLADSSWSANGVLPAAYRLEDKAGRSHNSRVHQQIHEFYGRERRRHGCVAGVFCRPTIRTVNRTRSARYPGNLSPGRGICMLKGRRVLVSLGTENELKEASL